MALHRQKMGQNPEQKAAVRVEVICSYLKTYSDPLHPESNYWTRILKEFKPLEKAVGDSLFSEAIANSVPLPSKDFTGRKDELDKLHAACQDNPRVAVTGLGGIGKTALVLKYADKHKKDYRFIHFIRAGSPASIAEGLLQLADDLKIPKVKEVEERLNLLRRNLEKIGKGYLLIFDGIDQVKTFQEFERYLPQRGQCILMTSRMPEEARIRNFEQIALKLFSREDAVEFLLKVTGSQEKEMAIELAKKLGKLPLALTHAAGYIRNKKTSIKKYIEQFDKYDVKLFEDKYLTLTKEEKTILTTWQINMDSIENVHKCPFAKDILCFFSFMGEGSVPLSFLEVWVKQFYPEVSHLDLGENLKCLCDYSMIASPSSDNYTVHCIVKSVIRYQLSPEYKEQLYKQLSVFFISLANKWDFEAATSWETCKKEASEWEEHVEAWKKDPLFATVSEEDKGIINFKIGSLYFERGNYQKALEKHLEACKVQGSWSTKRAESLNAISQCYYRLGRTDDALSDEKEALEIWKFFLGKKDPNVGTALNLLGLCCLQKQDYETAHKHLRDAHKIREEKFGSNHHLTAMFLNSIATAYVAEGKYKEALPQYEQVLKVYEQESHSVRLTMAINNVGDCYLHLKNYDKAVPSFLRSLEIAQKPESLGPFHPHVAIFLNNMGECYIGQKNPKEALQYFHRAEDICEKTLGSDHPFFKTVLHNIGECYKSQGLDKESGEYSSKARAIRGDLASFC